jgi:hypothetical protein
MSVDRVALLREELEDRPADPFKDLLDRFRDYLDARNRSDRTVKIVSMLLVIVDALAHKYFIDG